MSVDAIKEELTRMNAEERQSVRDFLYLLGLEEDAGFRSEITRRLDNHEPGAWIPAKEAFTQLETGVDSDIGAKSQ